MACASLAACFMPSEYALTFLFAADESPTRSRARATASASLSPSTLSFTTVDVGNPAGNVIPAEARAQFNYNNPFVGTMRRERKMATRAVTAGLGKVEPTSTDTLIAYAARAGSTADDGDGQHSPFTAAVLKNLTVPGLDVRLAFGRIRDDVLKITDNRQEPFVYGSLPPESFYFVPPK